MWPHSDDTLRPAMVIRQSSMPIAAMWVLIAAVAMTACAAPPANTGSREDPARARQRRRGVGATKGGGVSSALRAADISGVRNAAVDSASQDD